MIIQEIPIIPQPFTKNIINANLNGQQCQITINAGNEFEQDTLNIDYYDMYFNMDYNGAEIVRGAFCRSRANLTPFTMPRNQLPQFVGNVFFYSPYTTQNPKYSMFGTTYKLIFSDEFAFNPREKQHIEFMNELNKLFKL